MTDQERIYLQTLSLEDLLSYYEYAVRHSHYCPGHCLCFEGFAFKISYHDIKEFIKKNYIKKS